MALKRHGLGNLASVLGLCGALAGFIGNSAHAQDTGIGPGGIVSSGKMQFRQYCAQCHGMDATGNGPVAAALKKKPALDTYATLSGSVFNDSGYALPDAGVTVVPEAQDKVKPMQAVSDARGEFVLHLPPGPAQYSVTVSAKGYKKLRKSVSVQDQERVEVTFQLEPESK